MLATTLLGILVGGRSSRMGGVPKGLLSSPRQTSQGRNLVESLAFEFRAVLPSAGVVIVGGVETDAYGLLGFERLADDPPGLGPMGGVRSLLQEGKRRHSRIALVGCDLPYIDALLFEKLLTYAPQALAIAPRNGTRWEPLFCRVDPVIGLPALDTVLAAGKTSLQAWLDAANCTALPLSDAQWRQLADWDSPADISAGPADSRSLVKEP